MYLRRTDEYVQSPQVVPSRRQSSPDMFAPSSDDEYVCQEQEATPLFQSIDDQEIMEFCNNPCFLNESDDELCHPLDTGTFAAWAKSSDQTSLSDIKSPVTVQIKGMIGDPPVQLLVHDGQHWVTAKISARYTNDISLGRIDCGDLIIIHKTKGGLNNLEICKLTRPTSIQLKTPHQLNTSLTPFHMCHDVQIGWGKVITRRGACVNN